MAHCGNEERCPLLFSSWAYFKVIRNHRLFSSYLYSHTTKLNVNSRYRRARTSKVSKTSADRRRSTKDAPRRERAESSDLVYALYLRPEWLALTCRLETSIPALPSRRKTLHSGRTLTTNGLSMGHQETHLFRYAFIFPLGFIMKDQEIIFAICMWKVSKYYILSML